MKRLRLAVIGFGSLGRACTEVILDAPSADLELAGIVRRPETLSQALPDRLRDTPVAVHVSELRQVEVALVCVPTQCALGVATELLQRRVPVVECASLEGVAFEAHRAELDRVARHHRVAAIVGAGWNPGLLTRLQQLFELLIPRGHTHLTNRPGLSLHHTAAAERVPGVKGALCSEHRGADGVLRRYVYVELEPAADFRPVREAIESDPLFVGEATEVFEVDGLAELEEKGHGIVLERHGTAGAAVHDTLLLEARFDASAFTARLMVDAARHAPRLAPGAWAYSPLPETWPLASRL